MISSDRSVTPEKREGKLNSFQRIDFLNDQQAKLYDEFQSFVSQEVEPHAGVWDQQQAVPASVISLMAARGYLGSALPEKFDGKDWDCVTFGLLNEAFGRGMSSLTDLITVQAMVSMTLLRWGTEEQKSRWLPPLAKGELIGAYAMTEPNTGSDLQNLTTEFKKSGVAQLTLNGTKRWISFGQDAGLLLVFGKLENKPVACLVPTDVQGILIEPINELMGFRAARLAQIKFNKVKVAASNIIGKPGFALSHIAPIGLHHGRISTACSALGLLRGCCEQSLTRVTKRQVAGVNIGELGMIQSMIVRMGTDLEAGRLLCLNACVAEDQHRPESFTKVMMAKYFVTKAVVRAASDAVQIHGAAGCHESSPVARYYRDAKIMEIIEGTTQIHEQLLSRTFIEAAPREKPHENNFVKDA